MSTCGDKHPFVNAIEGLIEYANVYLSDRIFVVGETATNRRFHDEIRRDLKSAKAGIALFNQLVEACVDAEKALNKGELCDSALCPHTDCTLAKVRKVLEMVNSTKTTNEPLPKP